MPTRKPEHTHEVYSTRDTGVHKPGQTVGYYQSASRARQAADKHDNNYGAYAYQARPLEGVLSRAAQAAKEPEQSVTVEPTNPNVYGR